MFLVDLFFLSAASQCEVCTLLLLAYAKTSMPPCPSSAPWCLTRKWSTPGVSHLSATPPPWKSCASWASKCSRYFRCFTARLDFAYIPFFPVCFAILFFLPYFCPSICLRSFLLCTFLQQICLCMSSFEVDRFRASGHGAASEFLVFCRQERCFNFIGTSQIESNRCHCVTTGGGATLNRLSIVFVCWLFLFHLFPFLLLCMLCVTHECVRANACTQACTQARAHTCAHAHLHILLFVGQTSAWRRSC